MKTDALKLKKRPLLLDEYLVPAGRAALPEGRSMDRAVAERVIKSSAKVRSKAPPKTAELIAEKMQAKFK